MAFVAGATFDDFIADVKMRRAVERDLEIIGEAANRLSAAFRQARADVPWRAIITQRHVLAHEYGEILPDRIWRVVTARLPELAAQLAALERREAGG